MKTLTRARAFVIYQSKILMMKRIKDGFEYYTLLGGKVEQDEMPEQGCVREVMEECGIEIQTLGEITRESDVYQDILNTHIIYECTYISGTPTLGGEEIQRHSADNYYEPMWVDIGTIKTLTIKPDWMAEFLTKHCD